VPIANKHGDIEAVYQPMQIWRERPDSVGGIPVSDRNEIDNGPACFAEKRLERLKVARRRRRRPGIRFEQRDVE
jgi:hypothetical protein